MSNRDNFVKFFMSQPATTGLTMGGFSRAAQWAAEREKLMVRMHAWGLTAEQAQTIMESERRLVTRDSPNAFAEARLNDWAEHGYLTVLLGEVLAEDELMDQPFSYGTILNGHWMDRRYARLFAAMDRSKQHGLVKAAIALTTELGGATEGWPLERAMAAVMPYLEAER